MEKVKSVTIEFFPENVPGNDRDEVFRILTRLAAAFRRGEEFRETCNMGGLPTSAISTTYTNRG